MLSVSDMADVITDWANYTSLAGDLDNVETSKIQGTYDWRSYLREEADAAREREAERAKSRGGKKALRAPLPPVPSSLYA